MKRRDLLRRLGQAGCQLKRHGANHDIYENPTTNRKAPVPRHREIPESLCRLILRQRDIADDPEHGNRAHGESEHA